MQHFLDCHGNYKLSPVLPSIIHVYCLGEEANDVLTLTNDKQKSYTALAKFDDECRGESIFGGGCRAILDLPPPPPPPPPPPQDEIPRGGQSLAELSIGRKTVPQTDKQLTPKYGHTLPSFTERMKVSKQSKNRTLECPTQGA
jgi:hypothetical protein